VSALAENPIVDGSKAARELGHAPRSVQDTIEDLVRWFGENAPAATRP
jgi:nucleoside-diphosphate-sugar epimerase